MSISYKVLDDVARIFDCDCLDVSNNKFYLDLLRDVNNKVENVFSGVYFLDDVCLSKKASILGDALLDKTNSDYDIFYDEKNSALLKFLNSKSEKTFCVDSAFLLEFLNCDVDFREYSFIFSKLLIKNSFFGFVCLARKGEFSIEEVSVLNLLVSVYSYMIKDFELNKVFKMQLGLLQEAILDKENAYKVIEKQNKKLVQADSVKTNFLANVSHELRTPLNAIMGFSDVLLAKVFGELNDKQEEYIKDINLSGVHLMGLINSLLDFSKIESGAVKLNLSEFESKRAIDEVINLLQPLFCAKEINLEFEDNCDDLICADYQKFQQILFNLIGNAIKFSDQKGKISVRTSKVGEYFILEVEDTGIGIEKKYHNFIFKKFTQIDNIHTKNNTSTGLGLAIVKEYVKLHKGKIYVVSNPGQGSTFVVKLKNRI